MLADRSNPWDLRAYLRVRRWRDTALRPLSSGLVSLGVSPFAVSLFGVALAATTCWTLENATPWALAAFLGALVCDAMDGALARHLGTGSSSGKIVDHACDTATFLLILLAIALAGRGAPVEVALCATIAAPLLAIAIHARRRTQREGTKREPAGGLLAHLHKAPVYLSFLVFTGGGVDVIGPAVRLANITAGISLLVVVTSLFLTQSSATPSPAIGQRRLR